MDLTRSNLPGVRKTPFGSDLGTFGLKLVADLGSVRGVPIKLGLDGDLDKLGI